MSNAAASKSEQQTLGQVHMSDEEVVYTLGGQF